MTGYIRQDSVLALVEEMRGWRSPLLEIEIERDAGGLSIYRPDKRPFMRFEEIEQLRAEAITLARNAEQRAELLVAKLRSLGIDLDLL